MNIGDAGEVSRSEARSRRGLWLGIIITVILLFVILAIVWWNNRPVEFAEAPEAEIVLNTQVDLPFQVLIPAYLPKKFNREKTQLNIETAGPDGEQMIQLVYVTRKGDTLTISEWLPNDKAAGGRKTAYCKCICSSSMDCGSVEMGMEIGSLRLRAQVSSPDVLTSEEARFILDTLGPAVNQQVYTSLEDVPVTYSAGPAVEIPVNDQGIQEVTLVVTPNGYTPEHFSVQKGIPVQLTFRQLGYVGCGDELIFQWEKGKSTTLELASSSDTQTLEFTPGEGGDFRFNCPHLFYRGVMTVTE